MENKVERDKNWDVGQLTGETVKLLKLMPKDIPDSAPASTEIKAILGNLRGIESIFHLVRNPAAHTPKVNWKMDETKTLDILTLISFALTTGCCHIAIIGSWVWINEYAR